MCPVCIPSLEGHLESCTIYELAIHAAAAQQRQRIPLP